MKRVCLIAAFAAFARVSATIAQFGICPKGHYCPRGSGTPLPCPPGKMSSALGLERESQCRNCTAGYYCQNSSTVVATVPCEPGFYCEEGTATPTLDCWKGHHCAGGNPIPFPCEAGTYQNATGQASCRTCPAGYYCNEAEVFPDECPSGYYCPPETSFATKFPCPNGTFNNKTTTTGIDECSPCIGGMYCETAGLSWPTGHCSDGYYCGRGSHSATPDDGEDESIYLGETCSDQGDAQVNGVCPRGHFCPEGSSSPTQCPPGKMNAAKGQYNLNQCEECRAGFYCPRSATINATDLCEPGFYCPGGDVDPTFECTLGHFCAGGDKESVNCASGSYQNVTGQAECHPCPAGYFCEEAQVTPAECPKGHYCPAGTKYATEFPCPNGTFSNKTMLSTVAECTECIATMYCETEGLFEPTGLCHGGYYCAHGSATPTPGDNENYFYIGDTCSDQSDEEVNGVCPIGHYCPIGSSAPLQCPPGTMSDARGLSDIGECQECLGGFVCPESATINATVPCEPGFWCPGGDATPTLLCTQGHFCPGGDVIPISCPPGSYNNLTGQTTCLSCPAGYYCGEATIVPEDCPHGHWCPVGTMYGTEYACPNGTFSNKTKLSEPSECTECTAGFYCETDGLFGPTGPCEAGFYCARGSATPTPGDGAEYFYTGEACSEQSEAEINGVCPVGHYCPLGSRAPTQCPPGTMSSARGLKNVTQCQPCRPGFTCPESATINATIPCNSGFWCPGGDATSTVLCTRGHYCPGGDAVPIPCEPGTYANVTGQISCHSCPAGYFCEEGTLVPEACPAGFWCPTGTKFSTEFSCPSGTYSNRTLLSEASSCTECTAGFYCETEGLSWPTGPCAAGYFCGLGSSTPTPGDNDDYYYNGETCADQSDAEINGVCPIGHYCPEGSSAPIQCPPGSMSSARGLTNESECEDCLAGYTCPNSGMVNTTTPCDAGFSCPGGDATSTVLCTLGHYCAGGNAVPTPCDSGTYTNVTGRSACFTCPKGYFCLEGTITPQECPVGFWCPAGTKYGTEYPCAPGTFSTAWGLENANDCTLCAFGTYCGSYGLTAPEGPCGPGHYCLEGASSPQPDGSNSTGGLCSGGYVCVLGSSSSSPTGLDSSGYPCPIGSFCPVGSSHEQGCAPGTYQPSRGQASCMLCPPGYTCAGNTSMPETCPIGRYCESGSILGAICPGGTYGREDGLESTDQCAACPPRKYCKDGNITGTCSAGHFCRSSSSEATPEQRVSAELESTYDETVWSNFLHGQCPPSHYCPFGSETPTLCPNATWRNWTHGTSLDDCEPCQAGYKCIPGDPVPVPSPRGYYSPLGLDPIPCPVYTFNSRLARTALHDCLPCPAGYFCDQEATAFYGQHPCREGHWCPFRAEIEVPCHAGTYNPEVAATNITDCITCPPGYYCDVAASSPTFCVDPDNKVGFYCPEGSANMTLCPPGSYCPQFPASTGLPIKCPAGYYCPQGSLEPVICFNGTFCPPGSAIYKYCPLGYVGRADANNTLTSIGDACEVCPPGTTGTDPVRLECIECLPGYVCLGATTSATPTDRFIEKGYVCPPGSYCPAGSGNEILCDAGSANPTSGQSNSSVCVLCDEDFYSSISGQAYCKQCSSTSRAVSRGSTHCSCIGLNRAFQTSGLCPCEPGYEWYDTTNFQPRTDNGDVDCQPKVFERCFFDDIRDHTGRCTAENDCSLQCGAESGTRDPTSGLCICDGMQTLAEACDTDCRTESDTIYYDSILDEFVVADASGNLTSIQTLELDGFMGSLSCPDDTCTVVSMTTSGGRFEGNFGAGESLTFTRERKRRLEALGVKDTVASTYRRRWRALEASRTRRWREREGSHEEEYGTGVDANETIWSNNANMDPDRREAAEIFLESSSSSRNLEGEALYPSVAQPVVCINEGDAVLFDVTNEQYPVYDVDSLINSNPGFDYSEFTSLAETAQSTATVSSFLFTFADPGVYVFKMNSNSNSLTIIKVMRPGTVCSTEATFTPMTKSNLNAVKAKLDEDIVLDPDWQVLGGLLGCFAVAVFGIIGAVYFFRKHEWETAGAKSRRKYRERAKRADLKGHISKGVELPRGGKHDVDEETTFVEHAPRSDPSNLTGGTSLSKTSALTATGRRGPPEPDDLLDDLDEEELARQLQRHHDLVEQEFFGQRELVQQLHDAVTHEVDDLKKLLAVSLADQHGIGNATIEALQMLKQEATARRLGDGRCGSAETETFRLVDELQRLLDEGSDRMSRRIVEEVVQATGSAIGASMADTRGGEVASSATAEQITVPESETLIGLRSSVDNLCSLIEVGLGQGSENEARRRRTRLAAWDRFVATHPQLSLPARIIELLAQVQAADETTDRAATKLAGLLASFASHSKHFSRNLSERETALSQELAQTFIDTERASALPEQEQTKRRGITTFTALLDQLRDALLSVFGSSVDVDVLKKRALPASSRLVAEELRIELDNAVEEALANIPRDTLLHEISGQLRSVLDKLDSGVPLALDQLAPIAEFSRNSSLQERQRQDREHKIAEAASKDALEAEVQLDSAQRESAQRLDEGAAIRVENLSSDLTDADRALLQAAVEKDKREAQAALEAERQRQADRVHQITPAPIVESPKIAMEETEAEMLSNRFEELASELSAASEALRLGNVEAIRVVQTRELAALNSRLGAGADSERSALMKELAAKRFERVCGGEVPEAVAKDEALSLQTLQARLRQKSEEERGGAAAAHAEAIANASIDSPLQALIDAHNREKAAIALLEEIIGGHLIPVWKEDVQAELVEMREAINLSDRVDSVESTASLLEMEQLAAECDEFITARGIRLKRTVDKARLEASLRDEERRRRSELDARLAAQQRAIEVDLESAERNLERVKNASDDQREIEDALLAVEASRRDANNFDSNKEMQDLKSRLKQAEMAGRARLDDSMAIERARHHQHLRDRLVARREKAQSRLDATRAAIEEADDEFEHEKLFGTASTEAASEKKLEAAKKAADAAQEVATALILREQDLNRKIADIDEAEVTALRERVENVTKKQTAALAELERSSEVEAERKRARLEQRIAERRDQLASTAQAKRAALEAARIQASMDDHDVGAAARVAQLEQELQDTEKLCASQDDMAEEERRALSKTLLAERDHKGMRLDAQLELERKVANEALRAKLDARRRAAATVAAAKMAISDGSGDKDVNESCEDLSNELNLVDAEIAESDARLTAALLQSRADDEARLAFALGNEAEAKAAAVQRRLKARKQQAELEASLHFAGAKAKIANGESAENEDKAARDATTAAVDIEKQLRDVLKNQDVDETKRLKASEIRSEIEARRDDLAKVLEDECKSREAALRDRLARRRAKYEADVASKESNAKVAAEKALKVREEARRLQDENAPGDLVDAARSAARACESEASIAAEATAHAKLALQTQLEENEAEIERAVKQLREDRDAEISRFERESLAARSKAHEELHSRLDARRRGREARAQAKLRAAEAGTASSTEESKRLFDEASAAVAALCELENEDMEDEKRVMAELSKMEDSQAHRVRSAWESEQDRSRSKLKARLEARLAKAAAKELAAKNEHVQDDEESVQAVHNEARVAAAVLDRQIAEAALNDMDEPSFVSDEDEEERLLAEEIRRGRGRAAALLEARLAADYENEQARLSTQYTEREAELKLEVEKSAEASDTAAELARIASEEASADPESKELSSLALARENAAKTASNAAASAARAKAGLQASREDDKRRLDEDFRDRREEHLAAIEEWFDAEHRRRIDAIRAGRALRRKKAEFEALTAEAAALRAAKHTEKLRASGVNDNSDAEAELRKAATEAAIKRMAFDKEFGASDSQKIPYAGHASTVSDDEDEDDDQKSRASMLKAVHMRELQTLESKLADQAAKSRADLESRLEARRKCGMRSTQNSTASLVSALSSPPELGPGADPLAAMGGRVLGSAADAVNELEAKALLEQQLLAERVGALEALLAGQKRDIEIGASAEEVANRVAAKLAEDQHQLSAALEAKKLELAEQKAVEREAMLSGLDEQSRARLMLLDREAADADRSAIAADTAERAAISKMEAARLAALAASRELSARDEAESKRLEALETLRAKHDAQAKALESDMDAERAKRRARLLERRAERTAADPKSKSVEDNDNIELLMTADADETRRAALVAQQKAEHDSAEALFAKIASLEKERSDREAELAHSAEREKLAKRQMLAAKMLSGASRAAELAKIDAEVAARLKEEVSRVESEHADRIESVVQESEATEAAVTAASQQLAKIQDDESVRRAELDESLAKRRDRERKKLKDRLKARSQSSQASLRTSESTAAIPHDDELVEMANLEAKLDQQDLEAIAAAETAAANRYAAVAEAVVQVRNSVDSPPEDAGEAVDAAEKARAHVAELQSRENDDEVANAALKVAEEEARRAEQRASVAMARAAAVEAKRLADERASNAIELVREEAEQDAKKQRKERERRASQAKIAVLKTDAAQEAADVEARLDSARRGQKSKLQRRLEEKRRKQAEKKQAAEKEQAEKRAQVFARQGQTLQTQHSWGTELQSRALELGNDSDVDSVAALVRSALSEGIIPVEDAADAVEFVLRRRHAAESAKQLADQYSERSAKLAESLNALLDEKAQKRADLLSQQCKDEDRQAALEQLESDFFVKQKRAQMEISASLEDTQLAEEAALRRRHMTEVMSVLRTLDVLPARALQSVALKKQEEIAIDGSISNKPSSEAEAEAMLAAAEAAELEALRKRMESEKEERLRQIEEERRTAEESAKQEHAAKIQAIQAEQEAAMAKEREAVAQQLLAEKNKLQADFQANLAAVEAEQNEEVKEKLLQKAQAERIRAEKEIKFHQAERRNALKDRLARRRENKIKQEEAELQVKLRQQEGDANRLKKQVAEETKLTTEMREQEARELHKQLKGSGANVTKWQDAKDHVLGKLRSAFGNDSRRNLAPSSSSSDIQDPLVRLQQQQTVASAGVAGRDLSMVEFREKLDRIELLIGKLTSAQASFEEQQQLNPGGAGNGIGGVPEATVPKLAGQLGSEATFYHDAEDPMPHGPDLVPIAKHRLSPSKLQRLEFAEKLIGCLGLGDKLELEIAESLPENSLTKSAFRNSYRYDESTSVLHVHIKRIGTYGDVALIILHAVSHIKSNELFDDTSPTFIAEFHRNFKVVMQQLVKMEADAEFSTSFERRQQHLSQTKRQGSSSSFDNAERPHHDFGRDALSDRIKAYADASGYPLLSEFMGRYESSATPADVARKDTV